MFERLKTALGNRFDAEIPNEQMAATAAAMLLLEVAWADHDILPAELERTKYALVELFSLSEARACEIVATAQRDHANSVSMYPFTKATNEALGYEEKVALLVCCWRLALADAELDRHEERAIRQIADLLFLSHEDFIAAKLTAKASQSA